MSEQMHLSASNDIPAGTDFEVNGVAFTIRALPAAVLERHKVAFGCDVLARGAGQARQLRWLTVVFDIARDKPVANGYSVDGAVVSHEKIAEIRFPEQHKDRLNKVYAEELSGMQGTYRSYTEESLTPPPEALAGRLIKIVKENFEELQKTARPLVISVTAATQAPALK